MNTKNLPRSLTQGVIALAILSGCGGGGEDPAAPMSAQAPAGMNAPQDKLQVAVSAVLVASEDAEEIPPDATAPLQIPLANLVSTVTIAQFHNFYNTKYKAYAFAIASNELLNAYNDARTFDATLPAMTLAGIRSDQVKFNDAFKSLNQLRLSSYKFAVRDKIRSGAASDPNRAFTLAELNKFLDGLLAYTPGEANFYKQYHQIYHTLIRAFFDSAGTHDQRTKFATLMTQAEDVNDKRFLRGDTPDSVSEKTILGIRTGVLEINYGTQTKPVERADLVHKYSMWNPLGWSPLYTIKSRNEHGKDSTDTEQAEGSYYGAGLMTSDAYVLTDAQWQGIDYYVEAHIAKNGNLPHHNTAQTRRALRGLTEFLVRETGHVYESYFAAQLIGRFSTQLITAGTRLGIDNKTIDLGVMAGQVHATITDAAELRKLSASSSKALGAAVMALTGIALGQAILNVYILKETKASFDPSLSAEKNKENALKRINAGLGLGTAAVSLGVLGFLGNYVIGSEDYRANMKQWLGSAMAVSDTALSVGEIVGVLKAGTQNTATGRTTLAIALIRFSGAAYTLAEKAGYQCFSRTFTKILHTEITPIRVTTWTAAMGAGFYLVRYVMVAFTDTAQ